MSALMQQTMQLSVKMSRGITFVNGLSDESDWHYAGKGKKVDQPNTPIFWYQPKNQENYRVIFADFSVREMPKDELPKIPASQPASAAPEPAKH